MDVNCNQETSRKIFAGKNSGMLELLGKGSSILLYFKHWETPIRHSLGKEKLILGHTDHPNDFPGFLTTIFSDSFRLYITFFVCLTVSLLLAFPFAKVVLNVNIHSYYTTY